jgi:hypothetical protein
VFVLGLRAIQELADKDVAHGAELAALRAENAALKMQQGAQRELLSALSREVVLLRAA